MASAVRPWHEARPGYFCPPGSGTSATNLILKRVADVLLSSILLILTAPVMLVAGLLIRLTSPGPIVYKQTRVGRGGVEFPLLKLRSMVDDAEKLSGPVWAADHDSRVTRIGRFLRKFRIDELPQLVNVLHGEMSVVGPRPERPNFVTELEDLLPGYALRKQVLPGITGLAQVCRSYGASREDAMKKLAYDLEYIGKAGFSLDLRILVRTVSVVLTGAGAR